MPAYGPVYGELSRKPSESRHNQYELQDVQEIAPSRITGSACTLNKLGAKPWSRRPEGLHATVLVSMIFPSPRALLPPGPATRRPRHATAGKRSLAAGGRVAWCRISWASQPSVGTDGVTTRSPGARQRPKHHHLLQLRLQCTGNFGNSACHEAAPS